MAEAVGADQSISALPCRRMIFAIGIKFGSGVGFWLVFGHAAPGRRSEGDAHAPSTEARPVDPSPLRGEYLAAPL